MKNIPCSKGVNAKYITGWIEKNEVNKLTEKHIVDIVTQREATEEKET